MAKKTILLNTSMAVILSAFLLVLLEIIYRIFILGWASLSPAKMDSIQPVGSSGLVRASAYEEVIYELAPDLDTYFKLAPFQTNSRGLRDREYELEKPAGTYRIAVVGDSFTMPSGVAVEDAYHSLLENRLNQREDGWRYEVLNFGVGGYSLRQYLGVLEHKALEYAPDLFLVGFCAETDHRRGLSPERLKGPYRAKPKRHSLYHSFAWQRIQNLFGKGMPLSQGLGTEPLEISEAEQAYMERIFAGIAELGRRESVGIVVAYLSNRARDPRMVREIAGANELAFVDVSRSFEGKPLEDYIIYRIDGHPNEAAHQIFADEIFDFLAESSVLPGRESPSSEPVS